MDKNSREEYGVVQNVRFHLLKETKEGYAKLWIVMPTDMMTSLFTSRKLKK